MKRKKTKHDKTLVLLLNVKGAQASWQVHAHLRHVMDGLKRFALPSEQLIKLLSIGWKEIPKILRTLRRWIKLKIVSNQRSKPLWQNA